MVLGQGRAFLLWVAFDLGIQILNLKWDNDIIA